MDESAWYSNIISILMDSFNWFKYEISCKLLCICIIFLSASSFIFKTSHPNLHNLMFKYQKSTKATFHTFKIIFVVVGFILSSFIFSYFLVKWSIAIIQILKIWRFHQKCFVWDSFRLITCVNRTKTRSRRKLNLVNSFNTIIDTNNMAHAETVTWYSEFTKANLYAFLFFFSKIASLTVVLKNFIFKKLSLFLKGSCGTVTKTRIF